MVWDLPVPGQDYRVRYLACECLFNIAKVANEENIGPGFAQGWRFVKPHEKKHLLGNIV